MCVKLFSGVVDHLYAENRDVLVGMICGYLPTLEGVFCR
jgi:hypothetical protein